MVQELAQNNGRRKRGRPRKQGQVTPQGRQNQIVSRLTNGIRSRAPILLGIESEAEWASHLDGYRVAYQPVGLVEENLVLMVAYQDWKLIHRLIPYENDRIYETLTHPDEYRIGSASADVIRELLELGEDLMREAIQVEQTRLDRYRVLSNGQTDGQIYSKAEAQEILSWMAGWIQEQLDDSQDDEQDDERHDDDASLDDQEEEVVVEDRDWTAAEIQEQLAIVGAAAGRSWQKELAAMMRLWADQLSRRSEEIDKGLRHLRLHRILGPRAHERVALYERQILGTRKALVNSLERLQALRLGRPIAAPLSVDVALTTNHETGLQPELP
jgi:hypothetical protein